VFPRPVLNDVARGEDRRDAGGDLLNGFQACGSVHFGHDHIDDDQIERLGGVAERLGAGASVGRGRDRIAELFEHARGHVAHDLLHALGGARDGKRVVPDLYDFELQSNPPRGRMLPELFAIHTGPWDIMSQHFITWEKPPPHPSSFTRLQLGWIDPAQVATLRPGETREVKLNPLALGNGLLAVRVPIDAHRFLLIENRQPVKGDDILPSAGLLVLEVDMTREEGAGIVRVADANPGVPRLRAAPFAPGTGQLRYYRNADAGVAVAPLAVEPNGTLRLVVTTPERIMEFVPNERP